MLLSDHMCAVNWWRLKSRRCESNKYGDAQEHHVTNGVFVHFLCTAYSVYTVRTAAVSAFSVDSCLCFPFQLAGATCYELNQFDYRNATSLLSVHWSVPSSVDDGGWVMRQVDWKSVTRTIDNNNGRDSRTTAAANERSLIRKIETRPSSQSHSSPVAFQVRSSQLTTSTRPSKRTIGYLPSTPSVIYRQWEHWRIYHLAIRKWSYCRTRLPWCPKFRLSPTQHTTIIVSPSVLSIRLFARCCLWSSLRRRCQSMVIASIECVCSLQLPLHHQSTLLSCWHDNQFYAWLLLPTCRYHTSPCPSKYAGGRRLLPVITTVAYCQPQNCALLPVTY